MCLCIRPYASAQFNWFTASSNTVQYIKSKQRICSGVFDDNCGIFFSDFPLELISRNICFIAKLRKPL